MSWREPIPFWVRDFAKGGVLEGKEVYAFELVVLAPPPRAPAS